jgi:hypothetical protein
VSCARVLALFLTCLASRDAEAQSTRPCDRLRTVEEATLDFAKDAFFDAMEKAGERIGERGIDRVAEGLDTGNAAKVRSGLRDVQRGNAIAKGASFISGVDDLVLGPINAYIEDPTEDGLNAAYGKFFQGVAKMSLQAADKSLGTSVMGVTGLVVAGGEIVIGTSRWAVEEMLDQGQRQQMEATLFGRGSDVALGTINNLFAQEPFFTSGPVRNRGWNRDNLGRMAKTEEELAAVWKLYGDFLKSGPMFTRQAKADTDRMLIEGWPHLRKFWAFKRAETFVEAGRFAFAREMAVVQDKAARGQLNACDDAAAATPTPSLAKPVKGAYGPPVKRFGTLAPNFENHEQKITASMSANSYSFSLERKPASEGAIMFAHTYSGNVPDILRPGDVIELTCESNARGTGRYPPNIGEGCHWDVEGNVILDPASTKGSFVGMASNGQLYAKGESKTKFKVGSGGGKIVIRAVQGGYYWGSSDNWNPAEYVYTFVP